MRVKAVAVPIHEDKDNVKRAQISYCGQVFSEG
jgi:hypothetical protein